MHVRVFRWIMKRLLRPLLDFDSDPNCFFQKCFQFWLR
jgi:hypothetical protein